MAEGNRFELPEAQTEGELRTLRETRDRLAAEVERLAGELTHVRGEWTQARRADQRQALRKAEELGALRDRASEAQERAARLEADLSNLRREQTEKSQARRSGELEQLRAEINHVRMEQQATAQALWELQRNQVAALAGMSRPGPVEGPPQGTPQMLEQAYMTASRSGLMDAGWYRKRYSDVSKSGADPVLHYLEYGWREGRRPGPAFDGAAYLAANPDLAAAGVNPLVHYQTDGVFELRPVAPGPVQRPASPATGLSDLPKAGRSSSNLWFFAGDLIEWLGDHDHLTGVGRVTSELLFAALLDEAAEVRLCVLDVAAQGLVQLSNWAPLEDLAQRTGRSFSSDEQLALDASRSRASARLSTGDHIVFTGVVWTEQYIALFRRLAAAGIRYSLLVHDIIPLLVVPTDDGRHARVFADWLKAALETAATIYVSNQVVAEDLARWSVAARIRPQARIAVVAFGSRLVAPLPGASGAVLARVERDNFVLCVGTIDVRKNQRSLLRIWQELVIRLGPEVCPQLVLAGRDDLSLQADPAFRSLQKVGKVALLTGLDDGEVAILYRACRFTAFPSTSEGYGLPVAESLTHGKLCLASDLSAIRSHAGDLAWYFDPASMLDAVATFERAITSPGDVEAAAARIAADHASRDWRDTFADMCDLINASDENPTGPLRDREVEAYAGSAALSERALLEKAAKWCVDVDPEVSILIVNWNAAALTMDCIRQVWAATEGVRYEILIADNGSCDAEVAPLRWLGAGVKLIEIGCNRFFGEANNIAVDAARGKFVCFLNNDAFVEVGWLTNLREAFKDHPQVGGVGPLFRFPDGRIQEGGGYVDKGGYPVRGGRGDAEASAELSQDTVVDYISAAALLVDRDLFLRVGGFDLRFEPAYYEDTDLCFKIRAAGKTVIYRPSAVVFHIEGASANGDPAAELRRKHLGDLNRGKFVARWGSYLRNRDEASLAAIRGKLGLSAAERPSIGPRKALPPAIVYTPEPLTPGGGERYLLTLAEVLLKTHDVTLVTPHPYSHSRIQDLAVGFRLDLSAVHIAIEAEARWDQADLQVVMGNHIIPLAPARGRVNLFHCQFPFPMAKPPAGTQRRTLEGYDRIIVNSRFTALHVEASINGFQLPDIPISILPPPSRQLAPGVKNESVLRILSVGRFFQGGHSKRHDLVIKAFKALSERYRRPVELHLAGSSHPAPENMAYLAELMASADGFPIHFHVNIDSEDLDALYASANVYWHATGLGSNLVAEPWAAEHFGISIVEAMSAGAIPLALASGGAREIITHGVDGFLYDNAEALIEETLDLISGNAERRARLSDEAMRRAGAFSVKAFADKFGLLLAEFKATAI
jgi:glycosyltransferase involved in cell wall biosynthesis/GT2 family glycosyltransferase